MRQNLFDVGIITGLGFWNLFWTCNAEVSELLLACGLLWGHVCMLVLHIYTCFGYNYASRLILEFHDAFYIQWYFAVFTMVTHLHCLHNSSGNYQGVTHCKLYSQYEVKILFSLLAKLRFFAGFSYSLQVIVVTASSVSHRRLKFLPLTIYDHLPIYSLS